MSHGFYRSRRDSIFAGVCGGIAESFDFNPWGVRLLFLLLLVPTGGFTALVYIVLALLMKKAPY